MLRALTLFLLFLAPSEVMSQRLIDIDPKEALVNLAMQEFRGMSPSIARRRATEPTLDYLVFSGGTHVAVVNHQYSAKPVAWSDIDLVVYIKSVEGASSMEKVIGPVTPYSRSEGNGTYVTYAMKAENEDLACLAYDVRGKADRLTGFICLPGSAPITPADAKRLIDSIGVKDRLPPA